VSLLARNAAITGGIGLYLYPFWVINVQSLRASDDVPEFPRYRPFSGFYRYELIGAIHIPMYRRRDVIGSIFL
jgi:uncharacterized protein Usg